MMESTGKRMRLRRAGACRLCGTALPAREEAIYERLTKTVRCLACPPPATGPGPGLSPLVVPPPTPAPPPGSDVPGASARREFERRQQKRDERIRAKHPRIGGLILRLSDEPASTRAWDTGALGEERLGARLNSLTSDRLRVLHDRRLPGSRANIDHLAVTPTGVWVIDAKRYNGRPTLRVEGGILRPRTEKLMVGSRDRSKLVEGVLKQVDVVRRLLGEHVPVTGALCFIEADWPLIGGAFTTRDVEVLWPKRLYKKLAAQESTGIDVASVHSRLAQDLPPA